MKMARVFLTNGCAMATMIVSMETMKHTPTVVRGGLWLFVVVCGGLWWFVVVCGSLW